MTNLTLYAILSTEVKNNYFYRKEIDHANHTNRDYAIGYYHAREIGATKERLITNRGYAIGYKH